MPSVRLIKAEGLRLILVILFYAAAIFTLLYSILHSETLEGKMPYLFILCVLPFGIYSEVMRLLYRKANSALQQDCDAVHCLQLADYVYRLDFLHQFRTKALYLKGFAMVDLDRVAEAAALVERNIKDSSSARKKLDFEYNYLCFLIAVSQKDNKKLNIAYKNICNFFSLNEHLNSDIRSLKSLIDGIYLFTTGQATKARKAFSSIRPEALSPHEQSCYNQYINIQKGGT